MAVTAGATRPQDSLLAFHFPKLLIGIKVGVFGEVILYFL
jgi:hypothetical protein